MKLLVDANLSRPWPGRLRDGGFAASHVIDHGLVDASDEEISTFALNNGLVVVGR